MRTLTATFPSVSPLRSTSSDGVLRHVQNLLVSICGSCATTGTTASARTMAPLDLYSSAQTNSGLTLELPATAQPAAIVELHQRSGLTWEELAGLFGVSRRSVHFWASGKPMNSSNEEVLNQLLHVVRTIDRGGSAATRSALMSIHTDGATPFDLLTEGRYREVMLRLGQGSNRGAIVRSPLRAAGNPLWTPPSPDRLVGAVHDTAHESFGRARAGRSVKVKKTP
jgi:DNA-binding transcriptional regulator YiaG